VAYSTHEGAGGDNRGIWSRACGASGGEGPNKEATTSTMGYTGLFGQEEHEKQTTRVEQPGETVAHTSDKGLQGNERIRSNEGQDRVRAKGADGTTPKCGNDGTGGGWWATEPSVGRVAHGVPKRVDRLKQLGNAVVPQIVEQIGRAIMEIENG
jgi:site-specific DNA-cytosine methylase